MQQARQPCWTAEALAMTAYEHPTLLVQAEVVCYS